MIQQSRINPKFSAYNQVWGNFNFNKTPLAPPGKVTYSTQKAKLKNIKSKIDDYV